jgi:Bifunctional DNA primase/polymerase, N-terminal/Helix-turn-helix domain
VSPARAALDNPMLGAAVECARHGLPVYPARVKGKAPPHRGWQRAATTKPEHLVKAWGKEPRANVGILCRNLTVLDADSARGVDAVEELGLPATTTVRTARGNHYYFLGRRPTVPGLLPDVEVRGSDSGVLGPGSVHPCGFEYRWEIAPWEVSPVPIPPELGHLLDQRQPTHTGVTENFVFEGGRRVHLLRVAGSLRGRYGVPELLPVLQAINDVQCRPRLTEAQVEKIANDASKYPHPPPWIGDPIAYCDDSRLSTAARLVLRLLVDHACPEGRSFPGIRRLAQLANASPKTVIKSIRELEQVGRVEVSRSRSGNRYRLLPAGGA